MCGCVCVYVFIHENPAKRKQITHDSKEDERAQPKEYVHIGCRKRLPVFPPTGPREGKGGQQWESSWDFSILDYYYTTTAAIQLVLFFFKIIIF